MKKTILSLLFIAVAVNAVVIVPPVVYFISVSLATLFANALIALFGWIALQGFSEKVYGGKTVFEISKFVFSSLGKIVLVLTAMALAVILFPPFNLPSAIASGGFAAGIAFILSFLANARKLMAEEAKRKAVIGIIALALFAGVITSASSFFAIENHVVYKKTNFSEASQDLTIGSTSPNLDQALGVSSSTREKITPPPTQQSSVPSLNKNELLTELWFFPQNSSACTISAKDSILLKPNPVYSCYSPSDDGIKKIFCPINLALSSVQEKQGQEILVTSSGSCSQYYEVKVQSNGFEVISKG